MKYYRYDPLVHVYLVDYGEYIGFGWRPSPFFRTVYGLRPGTQPRASALMCGLDYEKVGRIRPPSERVLISNRLTNVPDRYEHADWGITLGVNGLLRNARDIAADPEGYIQALPREYGKQSPESLLRAFSQLTQP